MLTAEQVERFRDRGYLVVREMADRQTVSAMRVVVERDLAQASAPVELEAEVGYPGAPDHLEAPGGRTVRRLLRAYDRDAIFRQWVHDPGLSDCLRQLLGHDSIRFCPAHHNCVMTKRPQFSSDTGWHQDVRYWRFTAPELISVWLALTPEHAHNGGLRVLPGTHRMAVPADAFDGERFLQEGHPWAAARLAAAAEVRLQAGDVLFFHAALLHAASRNHTDQQKFSAVFTFHGPDTRPVPGTRSAALPGIPVADADGRGK